MIQYQWKLFDRQNLRRRVKIDDSDDDISNAVNVTCSECNVKKSDKISFIHNLKIDYFDLEKNNTIFQHYIPNFKFSLTYM